MNANTIIEDLSTRLAGATSALDAFRARIWELEEAIRETLMENLHLADGDICTLKKLKDAIGFELPEEE